MFVMWYNIYGKINSQHHIANPSANVVANTNNISTLLRRGTIFLSIEPINQAKTLYAMYLGIFRGTTMRTKAKFEKVSLAIFLQSGTQQTYNNIILPKRATIKSAGYDFFAPTDIDLEPNQTITVATGVRVLMPDDWCLMIFPRSGLGFKYRLRLDNTVGIIDADYSDAPNEGHIFIKLTNEGQKPLHIAQGTAFAQGIFTHYLLTEDDDVTKQRTGGLGSTDKK